VGKREGCCACALNVAERSTSRIAVAARIMVKCRLQEDYRHYSGVV